MTRLKFKEKNEINVNDMTILKGLELEKIGTLNLAINYI